jgi:hypothetical protein
VDKEVDKVAAVDKAPTVLKQLKFDLKKFVKLKINRL